MFEVGRKFKGAEVRRIEAGAGVRLRLLHSSSVALAGALGRRMVAFIARDRGEPVALALCFRDDQALYGRYWGCRGHYPGLHFELCFYQGIDRTLQRLYFDGNAWQPWQNLGGAIFSAPNCVWFGSTQTHCFGVGETGTLQHIWKGAGNDWQPWVSRGGALYLSRPSCIATSAARLDCFAWGAANPLAHLAYY